MEETFQDRVQAFMMACFGPEASNDWRLRNHHFLEEALELVQSKGCSQNEAHQIVDYVFGRPAGDPHQEVGGVMVTLAALCGAGKLDMHEAGDVELARVNGMHEQIRGRQAAKPRFSPVVSPSKPDEATKGLIVDRLHEMAGVCPICNARKCEHGGSTALPDTLNTGMVLHAINLGEFFFKE